MQQIQESINLKPYNTFGIASIAEQYISVESEGDVLALPSDLASKNTLILGGGSNMLLPDNYQGLVIHNNLKGYHHTEEGDDILLTVAAGEVWHDIVMYTVSNGWGGVENLALIPGTVGASPIQNIGAYGVELKDCFESLEAIDLGKRTKQTFTHEDCEFEYRESIFKRDLKEKVFITSVTLRLKKSPTKFHISYGSIKNELKEMGVELTPQSIADAVINIRSRKLPDPAELGNSGSFFKNPIISKTKYKKLARKYTDLVAYPVPAGMKLAAGWLIDYMGWKGKREGDAGCYEKQALVLVNYGDASMEEIWAFAQQIRTSVNREFDVLLEPEVNVFL